MADIHKIISTLTPDQQDAVIQVLDAVSRPMTAREIEGAMIGKGVSRTHRKIIAKVIEPLHIIALFGPECG